MARNLAAAAIGVCAVVLTAGVQGAQQTPEATRPVPTYTKDVAPILYKNCTTCHRPGEIAPMSLLTYKDARPWAKSIREEVASGMMPPWHADPAHGRFVNDRRLSDADKDTIVGWASAGAPEGDPADLPAAPKYADGWQIGQPDAIVSMAEDYPIPADGTVEYKYFSVPTTFGEDKWIQAIEVRPGSRAVVHHVILFARDPKPPAPRPAGEAAPRPTPTFMFAEGMEEPKNPDVEAKKKAPLNDRPAPQRLGAFVGGFAPGQSQRVYAPGTGIRLPAGAILTFQMHYTTKGAAATDRTKIGFIFAKDRPAQEIRVTELSNRNFTIAAGAANQEIDADVTLQRDVTLWSMLPHTHVRGKRWEYQATYPDGRIETILAVPKYDFNWQTEYVFKEPLKLPKGTKIHASAWYDNSANNPSNPDPSADVRWGDQTWEEMQFTALAYTIDAPVATTAGGKQVQ
jgi:hypothetical protein